jgi:hypothetical protein
LEFGNLIIICDLVLVVWNFYFYAKNISYLYMLQLPAQNSALAGKMPQLRAVE